MKKFLMISLLLNLSSYLTLNCNDEFEQFSSSYTNIFGENPSQVWTDNKSCSGNVCGTEDCRNN